MPEKTESQKRAQKAYMKKFARFSMRIEPELFEKVQSAASAARESVNGYIKQAIEMRMEEETPSEWYVCMIRHEPAVRCRNCGKTNYFIPTQRCPCCGKAMTNYRAVKYPSPEEITAMEKEIADKEQDSIDECRQNDKEGQP